MSGNTLALLTIGALAAASELARRGASNVSPSSGCRIIPITEQHADDVEARLGYDYYTFLEAIGNLWDRSELQMSTGEEPYEACITDDGMLYGASSLSESVGPYGPGHTTIRFSVAVEEVAQRQGVASRLIASILQRYPPVFSSCRSCGRQSPHGTAPQGEVRIQAGEPCRSVAPHLGGPCRSGWTTVD